jgi:nickel/cobalt transporter (NicO) family protein
MTPRRRLRAGLALVVGCLLGIASPAAAMAHPLGNFTINHYSGLRIAADRITIDQIFDFAEIPALQALQATDGDFGPGGAAGYGRERCGELAPSLTLTVDGARRGLSLIGAGASLPPGQGGLATLRLVCTYEARFGTSAAGIRDVTFVDGAFAERIGWREIVVEADGVSLRGGDPLTRSPSARLTRYPDDLLSQPLDRASVAVGVVSGGPSLPPLVIPDAAPMTSASLTSEDRPQAVVPGGAPALPTQLTELLRSDDLSPPLLTLGLLIAVGLGAVHALTPGHGKTIMAAYLVGTRGDVRQAIGLGATVAVAHTVGVLALALVVLGAASTLPPERLFPILSAASALLVTAIGGWLLLDAIRRLHRDRQARGAHMTAGDHRHGHDDPHGHDGPAGRGHAVDGHAHATNEHGHALHGHEHGGIRHSHVLPVEAGQSIRWRGIVTLGLAGGLVPSASAILLLLGAVAAERPLLGVGLVIAFGLGMAAVLGAIGLLLVRARGIADRLPSVARDGRLGLTTSLAAATVVFALGLILMTQSLGGPG